LPSAFHRSTGGRILRGKGGKGTRHRGQGEKKLSEDTEKGTDSVCHAQRGKDGDVLKKKKGVDMLKNWRASSLRGGVFSTLIIRKWGGEGEKEGCGDILFVTEKKMGTLRKGKGVVQRSRGGDQLPLGEENRHRKKN